MSKEESKLGYKRALDRHPELAGSVKNFEQWLESVEIWMNWVEKHIPDNIHASKAEVLESFHMTPLGLEMLERLNLDIHPEGREDKERVEYDVKKLLRAVVALPTIARITGKKLDRKGQNITTIFKEVIDDTLNGRLDIDAISKWKAEGSSISSNPSAPG